MVRTEVAPPTINREDARRLLEQIAVLKHACDLDLLIFFARHPRSLLTSESLRGFLGYDLKDIAKSLEVLLAAGLLTRSQTPAHAARLYVLAGDGTNAGTTSRWLSALVAFASTREGHLALREALPLRRCDGDGPVARSERQEGTPLGPRRISATPRSRSAKE